MSAEGITSGSACWRWVQLTVFFTAACTCTANDWNNPPKGKAGVLQHHTFRSASMGVDVGFNICLPPEYTKESEKRFPVVYYLHGYDGHESSYPEYATYWQQAARTTGPCLLVFVNGGNTSFFSDSPNGRVMGETVVVKELIPNIDARFRTVADANGRSLHGYSMGAFGALKLGMKYPEQFGSVVAYGATLAGQRDMEQKLKKVYREMFGSAERYAANDPLALARTPARGDTAFQIVIGSKDEFLELNRRLRDALVASKRPHEFIELPGVKHDKDAIYPKAAANAFEFSSKRFRAQAAGGRAAR